MRSAAEEATPSPLHIPMPTTTPLSTLIASMRQCLDALESEVHQTATLQEELASAREELDNLRKVSRIIAIENENARLKTHCELLNRQLQNARKHSSGPQAETREVPAPQKEQEEQEELEVEDEEEEEESVDVYEHTLDGRTFYVTQDDTASIYEKLDDGSVGNYLGFLRTLPSGKSTITKTPPGKF
jgi:hypothetical protein